jgi:ABC-type polysaccharide/polyol phosphate export permease
MTLVVGIGINYAALFHQEIKELLPYVAMGLVFWGYIAAVIAEGGEAFVVGSAMIKQSCLPLPLFILRTLIRNVIILAHQIVIVAGVMIYFSIFPGLGLLWAFVGLFVVTINLTWIGLMLSMVSARFRDMPQIVAAILQLLFFLSPIIWHPNAKLENNPLVNANPFYLAVQSIRDPILHGTERIEVFTWLIPSAIIGWLATIIVYNQTRRRVVHYL